MECWLVLGSNGDPGGSMWLRKKAYNEAINALREAETYADELEPKPGEQISKDRMERWALQSSWWKSWKTRLGASPERWQARVIKYKILARFERSVPGAPRSGGKESSWGGG